MKSSDGCVLSLNRYFCDKTLIDFGDAVNLKEFLKLRQQKYYKETLSEVENYNFLSLNAKCNILYSLAQIDFLEAQEIEKIFVRNCLFDKDGLVQEYALNTIEIWSCSFPEFLVNWEKLYE